MNKFLILHYGFEKPSPEDMSKWTAWFESIKDRQIERGHFPNGNEINKEAINGLPFGSESITGFTMISADNLDEATEIAAKCPVVLSTRVYQISG